MQDIGADRAHWASKHAERVAAIEGAKQAHGVLDPLSIYIENS